MQIVSTNRIGGHVFSTPELIATPRLSILLEVENVPEILRAFLRT